jgi:hypothetical protein
MQKDQLSQRKEPVAANRKLWVRHPWILIFGKDATRGKREGPECQQLLLGNKHIGVDAKGLKDF